jgi:hypothetical protein
MNTKFLFPNACKAIGFVLFLAGLLGGIALIIWEPVMGFFDTQVFAVIEDPVLSEKKYFTWIENNILDEIIGSLLIIGGVLLAFSREKTEDEFITTLRMESLLWATYINYGVLLISFWFLFSLTFYWVLILNIFTLLLFFNARYYWILFRTRQAADHEE